MSQQRASPSGASSAARRSTIHRTRVEEHAPCDLLLDAQQVQVVESDVDDYLLSTPRPFDIVFLDPPYGKGLGEKALAAALAGGWIAPGALVVWEESARVTPPAGLTELDERRYGDTVIHLLEAG